ncbi:MAG TPA: protein kinase [Planctomycetota bacterium]|nr:protein kinase [Planctomycetota bacterium]
MPDRSPRLDELFNAARRLADPAARRSYLEAACGGDRSLRAQVEALLSAYDGAGSFLAGPAAGLALDADLVEPAPSPRETVGSMVGSYRLLEEVGEGGCGIVYMAEQQRPVRRKVALKLIKPGLDTRQVIARFEAERQALALMDHENIARVLDAGATDSGRPYFVMELVHGVPITEFCDTNRLPPAARLALFVQVCRAVQHAHTKGVIHRDLKPTNVLVTLREGVPVPKVIDFGIAKATGPRLTERTLFTGFAQMIGTPLYMSPEQAEMSGVDVDTRSDVYSLGVVLYELLTGTTPMDRARLKEAAFDEVLRIVREEEPPKPSTRLSTLGERARIVSAARGCDPKRLDGLVRGDLDWIVMKALEKDRARRYETANGLAMDLERYLGDEPVLACPPTRTYRLRKFVRRNRAAVVAAAAVLVALIGGIVGTGIGLLRAEEARKGEAERAKGERAAKERAEANLELARTSVETFLGTVTEDPDLRQAGFHRVRRSLLEGAIPFFERLAAQAGGEARAEAGRGLAHLRLASIHLALGEHERARADAEATRAVFARLVEQDPASPAYRYGLANAHHSLAVSLERAGRQAEAEASFGEALRQYGEVLAREPGNHGARHDSSDAHFDLGNVLRALGRTGAAEASFLSALGVSDVEGFPRDAKWRRQRAETLTALAGLRADVGRFAEAETALRESMTLQDGLAAEAAHDFGLRAEIASSHAFLGNLLHMQEMPDEAEAAILEGLRLRESLAAEFPALPQLRAQLAASLVAHGVLLSRSGKHLQAEPPLRRAVDVGAKLSAEFPRTPEYRHVWATALMTLANALDGQGMTDEAETAIREAARLAEALAKDFPDVPAYGLSVAALHCNLGLLVRDAGRPEASLEWFDRAATRLEAILAMEPGLVEARQFLLNSRAGQAAALDALGRHEEALKPRAEVRTHIVELHGPLHPEAVAATYELLDLYRALGRGADLLRLRQQVLEENRAALGPDHIETLGALSNVALSHDDAGEPARALEVRAKALAALREKFPDHPYLLVTLGTQADTLSALGRGGEAVPLIDEYVARATAPDIAAHVPHLLQLRLRHFERAKDSAGCRATAEMLERVGRRDPEGLYDAACFRAVTAAVLRAASGDARAVEEEAQQALAWLRKAVAAGFGDAEHVANDKDLDALRDREDFRRLVETLRPTR